ncbi:MAG: M48 family metallopeptidase [bacterium]
MGNWRFLLLFIIIIFGISLTVITFRKQIKTPLSSTLAPFFQVLGIPVKSVDTAISRVIPVDVLDEKEYGEAIAKEMSYKGTNHIYLNNIVTHLSRYAKKPFKYRVYVDDYGGIPNAYALPGGVIVISKALLTVLNSEAEVAAVIAHEMGHIELSHCFEAVKYELLMRKIKNASLGQLADIAIAVLIRHSFSKTQENEADEYAYNLILQTKYDPLCVGKAFKSLNSWDEKHIDNRQSDDEANIIRDYFLSHPPLKLRMEKFTERAQVWWKTHPKEKRFWGERREGKG